MVELPGFPQGVHTYEFDQATGQYICVPEFTRDFIDDASTLLDTEQRYFKGMILTHVNSPTNPAVSTQDPEKPLEVLLYRETHYGVHDDGFPRVLFKIGKDFYMKRRSAEATMLNGITTVEEERLKVFMDDARAKDLRVCQQEKWFEEEAWRANEFDQRRYYGKLE